MVVQLSFVQLICQDLNWKNWNGVCHHLFGRNGGTYHSSVNLLGFSTALSSTRSDIFSGFQVLLKFINSFANASKYYIAETVKLFILNSSKFN